MFHTFTGSSKRPRQVNLSGRNNDPFAALRSTSSSSHQPHLSAVQHAQEERKARQRDKQKLNAAKVIQRAWRHHALIQEQHRTRSRRWDELIESGNAEPDHVVASLLKFARPKQDPEDISRVLRACQILQAQQQDSVLLGIRNAAALLNILLDTLESTRQTNDSGKEDVLLSVLRNLCEKDASRIATQSERLFKVILESSSTKSEASLKQIYGIVTTIINQSGTKSVEAHTGLVAILGTPLLQHKSDLDRITDAINGGDLALAMQSQLKKGDLSLSINHSMLLAEYVYLSKHAGWNCIAALPSGSQATLSSDPHEVLAHIGVLTQLMSSLSQDEISDSPTTEQRSQQEFIDKQLAILVDKDTISDILGQFERSPIDGQQSEYASTLASYILTLIQQFPQRSDDIRLWIYLSSASKDSSGQRTPAIKFFWQALRDSTLFNDISKDTKNAVQLLNSQSRNSLSKARIQSLDRDWKLCLLFLELYMFVLRIMDDDEFMAGESADTNGASRRRRQSALSIPQVKDLILFLKNLAFAMYWNAADLATGEPIARNTSLSSYFNGSATISPEPTKPSNLDPLVVSGVQSSSLSYIKGIVTGLLRSLYERDSRLGFAPSRFWLMPQLDMSGFEVAVVQEQKHKYEQHDDDSDDEDAMDVDDSDQEDRDLQSLVGANRTQHLRRLAVIRKQQDRAIKRRRLAETFPRLNIMENMPFFIPFNTRVRIFREFVRQDQMIRRNGIVDADSWRMHMMSMRGMPVQRRSQRRDDPETAIRSRSARVRRNHVMEDAYDQLYQIGENLKEPISITFVDQFDTPEAGIDGGGVTKEFLTSVSEEAFVKGELQLFKENSQHLLYPNPVRLEQERAILRAADIMEQSPEWHMNLRELLKRYEFIGRVVGKCLYEGILLDVHFAPFFLVKWASRGGPGSASNENHYRASINDVRALDEELYKGLLDLKNYDGDAEDFALDFTIVDEISTEDEPLGSVMHTTELRTNGANIPVTNENKLVYIAAVARHRLQSQSRSQDRAFLTGLGTIIDPTWLAMFNQSELQTLVGGDLSELDVDDLRRNTIYSGVYQIGDDGEEHPTVKLFWRVVRELSDQDRRKLLKYVTSTPRAPLLGFSQLRPAFTIRDSGQDQQRLPSTSTCVNLLKLPQYQSKKVLRERLLYAITSGAGFDLS